MMSAMDEYSGDGWYQDSYVSSQSVPSSGCDCQQQSSGFSAPEVPLPPAVNQDAKVLPPPVPMGGDSAPMNEGTDGIAPISLQIPMSSVDTFENRTVTLPAKSVTHRIITEGT